jgi:hypothetical protein
LRLLDLEIARHDPGLKKFADPMKFRSSRIGLQEVQLWRTDTWEQTRVRLAQLLNSEEFTLLARYYQNAQDLNDLLTADYDTAQRGQQGPRLRNSMVDDGKKITDWIRTKLP